MPRKQIGIREFRENLARFLEGSEPVTITRHGETVGFYIPARRTFSESDRQALVAAGEKVRQMIAEAGITEEEILQELEELHEARRRAHRKAS